MTAVVGRDRELEAIESFLELADGAPRILLLEGEPGIGKSTLWRDGVDAARERGFSVLACTAAKSEAELSYTALRDLLGDAFDDVADTLPRPQRDALAVALLREEPSGPPPDAGVLGAAFVVALRELSKRCRTIVAVDDVQWLDASSAAVVGYALRRLDGESIVVLLARRAGESSPLELTREGVETVAVEPLSMGALHRIVVDRFDAPYSRPVLRQLHETSGGNPFYAIELARALARHGARLHPGEDFPVPASLEELVHERLSALSSPGRRTVAAAALLARPTTAELGSTGSIDEAFASGVLERDGGKVTFAHPLLAAAARVLLTPEDARSLHTELAAVVTDETERARHRALAADAPDRDVAEAADSAARSAAARGEHGTAVSLFGLALAMTAPDEVGSRQRRSYMLALELISLGEAADSRTQLERLVAELPAGGNRSEALVALATLRQDDDVHYGLALARQARNEADSSARRASAEAALSAITLQLGRMVEAREHAHAAVRLASEPGFLAQALAHEILVDTLAGASVSDEVVARATQLDERLASLVTYPVPLSLGLRRMYEDRHDEARQLLLSALEIYEERGEMTTPPHFHLTELEVRAGRFEEAAAHAAEALAEAEQWGLQGEVAPSLYAAALVDVHRGRQGEARANAEKAVALAQEAGDWIFECQGLAVLGLLELSLGRAAEAAAILEPLAAKLVESGVGDPSVWVGALPNAVEALIAIGEPARARTLLATLEEQGERLPGPWTRARAARAAGLLADAEGRYEDAVAAFERALGEAEIPIERGRTLLALGAVRRRRRQKRVARETLDEARRIFEELGAELWAEQARVELARIGGRVGSPTELTANERRIAELVADGKTNKEVAALLVVTDRTIESALTQIYRKLDVRSRTELARKLTRA